jgi:hypothetical protein
VHDVCHAGVPVFLANMTCAAWIKFSLFPGAAALMTIILALALLYLAFVHARWVHHVGSQSTRQQLDKGVRPVCTALRHALACTVTSTAH